MVVQQLFGRDQFLSPVIHLDENVQMLALLIDNCFVLVPGAKPNRIKKLYLDDTYYLFSCSFQFEFLFLFYYVAQMGKINR